MKKAKKRLFKVFKNGRKIYEYLFKCKKCGAEQYVSCKVFKTKKYCSMKCINVGRKHSNEFKQFLSVRNSGKNNPFYGKKHSNKSRKKMSKTHKIQGNNVQLMKNKLSKEDFDKWYNNFCAKFKGSKNHFYGKKHTIKTRKHLSDVKARLIASGKIDLKPSHYGLKGYYKSTKTNEVSRYDSLIELLRMKMLDMHDDVDNWTKKHNIRIKYKFNKDYKTYVPDFFIKNSNDEIIIEELKGYELDKKKNAKFKALKKYCNKNKYIHNILSYEDIDYMCVFYFGERIHVLRKKYHKGIL